jgi:hypothetical protein
VQYNDHYQVDHFHKMKAMDVWSLSEEPEDGVAIHYADDLYRRENEGKVSTRSIMMLMGVFKKLHADEPVKVKKLMDREYGMVQLYGSRPSPTCFNRQARSILTRSHVTIPTGFKGNEHCMQRVFAASMHLCFGISPNKINSFFTLASISALGPDTDPRTLNKCLRGEDVIEFLAKLGRPMAPVLRKPVIGDSCVRQLLRSMPRNTAVMTYPIDMQGLGRHCSLAFRPAAGRVIMWDPSPVYDMQEKCPLWLRHNEFSLRIRGYSEARVIEWRPTQTKQTYRNLKRSRKRKRNMFLKNTLEFMK